ncbi:MAG: glycoside hydrolase family 16 protein [Sedimentisphaerales bacterium]|nr:glycoside hydrolase family 16 protein [Sedimentisphaerales bacterium]
MRNTWIVIFTLSFSVFAGAQNLLFNGDFESGTIKGHFANGYPDGWQGWNENGWHHSDSGYTRDSYGIAIWANDTGCIQVVNASEGEQFDVSGEMIYHTTEVLNNKNAILEIEFWDGPDPTGSLLAETQVGVLTPAHSAGTWYTFSDTVTAPSGTTEARIICQTISTGGTSTGKAYWDNISLESENRINSPDYDNNLKVDLLDFAKLAGVWYQTSSLYNLAGPDVIDLEDLEVFLSAWSPSVDPYPGYELVWSDEFDAPGIDTSNWNWEIGDWGWGNNEWQYYTNHSDNSYISDGNLVIVARKDHLGHDYTSARMTTQNKRSFMYGRLEARIKLPAGGQGIWPAFWMLGNNISTIGWPECGETDILEVVNDFTNVYAALHYGSSDPYIHDSNGGSYNPGLDVSDDYHIYAIEWEPTVIRWYFDDVNYYSTSSWWANSAYPAPFNQGFFFILNIAVGGNWPGYPDESTPFPQYMHVDYVRVYQLEP